MRALTVYQVVSQFLEYNSVIIGCKGNVLFDGEMMDYNKDEISKFANRRVDWLSINNNKLVIELKGVYDYE